MSAEIAEKLQDWVERIEPDAKSLWMAVIDETADSDLREHSAAALNYLLTKMDLVPDWTDSIGAVDDAMVLRVSMAKVPDSAFTSAAGTYREELLQLKEEAQFVETVLGNELSAQLHQFCNTLRSKEVRQRTPKGIIEDVQGHLEMKNEIHDVTCRIAAPTFDDPGKQIAQLRSFLKAKLSQLT